MMKKVILLLLAVLILPVPAGAQGLPGNDPLTVLITPSYPRPYGEITINPRSTLLDLSASSVVISVDGNKVYTGSGTAGVVTRVGALGEKTTIVVTVTDPSGRVYTKQQVMRPAEVSLIMEPVSTAHPFYSGGSLVASEGRVRLVAVPDLRSNPSTRLSPAQLVYTWHVGSRLLTDESGIGKSILVAQAPVRYRNALVTVTVTSPDSSLVGEASTLISAVDPIARMYRSDPLLGPNFDVALPGTFSMSDTESTFRAVGYFFAVPPVLAWSVNGGTSGTDRDITVRAAGNGKGTAQLGISMRAADYYQSAESRAAISFGEGSPGFGFFGL